MIALFSGLLAFGWLAIPLLAAAALVAKLYFGIKLLGLASRAFAFLTSKEGRPYFIGLIALVGAWAFFDWGQRYERGSCDADKYRARIAQIEAERDTAIRERETANTRITIAAAVIAGLNKKTSTDAAEISRLNGELEKRPPQSTKPGAKHDPRALVDDKCRYTPLGARRLQN